MKRIPFNFDWKRIDGKSRWFAPNDDTTPVDLPDDFCLNGHRGPDVVGGEVTDVYKTNIGIRKIEIDFDNGMRLNGKPIKLRGGCIHHDNTLLGSRALPRAEERKIELLKAAGYNAIRCAHNPPSTAMLDVCDRLGMLVMDESFDMWNMGKNTLDYHLYFKDWWQFDTAAMVKRDRNHPSIYCWSIGNEIPEITGKSDGAYWARVQADFVRSLDHTRPITSAIHGASDMPPELESKMNLLHIDRKKAMIEGLKMPREIDGREVARTELVTAGCPARLALTPDRPVFDADGMDLCFVKIELQDAAGVPVVASPVEISVSVSGAGSLAGLGSANPRTTEDYGTGRRYTFDGRALVAIRAGRAPGDIELAVTAPGLPAAIVKLTTV